MDSRDDGLVALVFALAASLRVRGVLDFSELRVALIEMVDSGPEDADYRDVLLRLLELLEVVERRGPELRVIEGGHGRGGAASS